MRTQTLLLALFAFAFRQAHAAVDGNSSAVQAAIDAASPGSNVTITPGTYNWTSGVTVKKYVKIDGTGVTLNSQTGSALFVITPQASGSVEISGFTFNGGTSLHGYLVCNDAAGKPPLVHDCKFNTSGFGHGCVLWGHNGGVIWNCTFTSTDKSDNSAIAYKNDQSDDAWHDKDYLGMADTNGDKNTYVEDCSFNYHFLQAMDFDDNSRTVIRHCTFNNSAVASHGQDTSPIGARQIELYNNTFEFTKSPSPFPLNMNWFIYIRGGGPWLIHDNVMPDINSQDWGNKSEINVCLYNIRRRPNAVPCQTSYPAARQIGFGSDSSGRLVSSPVYIWGNSGGGNYDNPGFADYDPDECGNGKHTSDFVRMGRDLFTGTPKPGYQPFTYPHPLRTGGPSPSPTSTPQPTSTPTPFPSASPSVTPSPTAPPVSYSKWWDQIGEWIKQHPPTPNP